MTSRFLVVSDLHANPVALQAVLADAKSYGPFEGRLCAGDMLGYGYDPDTVIDMLREESFITILGNHDVAGIKAVTDGYNNLASTEGEELSYAIRKDNLDWLRTLSTEPYTDPQKRFAMVHGSFKKSDERDHEDVYVTNENHASEAIRSMPEGVSLGIIGHTHVPFYFMQGGTSALKLYGDNGPRESVLEPRKRHIFNPGSVGQPRNRSIKAQYGIVELNESGIPSRVLFLGTDYNIEYVKGRILERGLPEFNATRLFAGT